MPITNIKKLITKCIYLTLGDEIVALVQIAKTDSSLLLKVIRLLKKLSIAKKIVCYFWSCQHSPFRAHLSTWLK